MSDQINVPEPGSQSPRLQTNEHTEADIEGSERISLPDPDDDDDDDPPYKGPELLSTQPREILSIIIDILLHHDPPGAVCLALTNHKLHDIVTSLSGRTLKWLCPVSEELAHCRRNEFRFGVPDGDIDRLMYRLRRWVPWTYMLCDLQAKYFLRYGEHRCSRCLYRAVEDKEWQLREIQRRRAELKHKTKRRKAQASTVLPAT